MNKRTQRGAGLIEALISIFVVSIGLLGFAGLQLKGLVAANDSQFRSKAVYLSYQMADRVRANLTASDPATAAAAYYDFSTQVAPDPGCTVSVSCTQSQMAQNDFAEWLTEVKSALPSGAGVICLDSTPDDGTPSNAACDGLGNVLTIKLWWMEQGQQHRFVSTFRPT